MLRMCLFIAMMAVTLAGCESSGSLATLPGDAGSASRDTANYPKADWGTLPDGSQEVDEPSPDVLDPDSSGAEADASCVADPAMIDRIETACSGVNGSAVWKFDASTCTWAFGSLPNADPPLIEGIPPEDLQWARARYECPPLED